MFCLKILLYHKKSGNYVGISKTFECRWSYIKKSFIEEKSKEYGVAGLFIFEDKEVISDVSTSGEFVKYLSTKNITFNNCDLSGTCEFGLLSEYNKLETNKSRPFNKITIDGDIFIKEPINEQGKELAKKEINWYKEIKKFGFNSIPNIIKYNPLTMENIKGKNIYEYKDISIEKKKEILKRILEELDKLHNLSTQNINEKSIEDTYINKTFNRINKIQDLVPFAKDEFIYINDEKCKNIFFYKNELIKKIKEIKIKEFNLIHGDCTFSNIMLKDDSKPIFIDPRGYFGETLLYGDKNYDYAKLYYSVVGDYDRFNLKDFRLKINEKDVTLSINTNGWKELEDYFFENINADKNTIKLLHAIIWISLTTYAWQDYDSICGAFYNGLLYLKEVL